MNTTDTMNSCLNSDPLVIDADALFQRLPANRVGEIDRQYMDEIFTSGFGNFESASMVERFEEAFAEKFQAGYGISMNSGSGTLLSSLLGAGVGPGDEVIVPVYGMPAAAFATVQAGAVPVMADCDPSVYNIDPSDIERRITPWTRAIVVICHFGLPVDFDPILALARKHDLALIEDNAQCYLATYKGRLTGTFGDAAKLQLPGIKAHDIRWRRWHRDHQ